MQIRRESEAQEYYNIESDLVEIPVRAWNRPTVNDTPPSSAIDACTVSWYGDKYVGVVGEPVRLMADGATNNTGDDVPPEAVAKYIWYFDNNTLEPDQTAGQAVSYTWNSPNLSGQIRCKAETNYGVQSDEKLFNLTIYDAIEANAAGPYTSRPNTAVTLQGSVEKMKYPGAAFQYQWRVDSITPVGTLKGDATSTADYVQLTPDEPNKSGQFEYADLPVGDDWNVTGEFWSGGGTGVDAFYIYLWANGTPMTEDEAKGQYSINFDEYQDEIQLNYDGVRLADAPQLDLDNSQWRRFAVVFKEGIFRVYLDGKLRLVYDDSANYQTRMSNNLFGFAGRAGDWHNYHRVRNMKWTTGTPVATDSNGKSEYAWGPTGNESDTYGVEFTTTVTTQEGIVLIGSGSTSVTVEAGKPTAMPKGPYRCGIYGGSFSPNQFEGNHPDYIEADDVGHIVDWMWFFSDRSRSGIRQNSGDSGYALEFDGVGDYVEAAAIDERSVEMWIKPGKEAQMGLYSGGTAGADGKNYSIAIYERNGLGGDSTFDSNSAGLFLSFHGYDIAIPYDDILNEWHYIAISWDGGTGVLIGIDGQFLGGYVWDGTSWAKQSGQPFTLPGTPQPDPTAPTRIGGIYRPWDTGSEYFDGIIDEVAIWDVALTKDEILAHLDNSGELVGDEQGLVLYWKLEETEGMTAHDQSPNGNDGTLNPMTPVWNAEGHPVVSHGIWNPTHAFTTAGEYTAGLIVQSEFGKWSYQKTAKVEAIDGKIAGYVRAADLRTPVKEVTLTLTSSHVYESVLAQIATSDDSLNTTGEGGLQTLTDDNGYYEFAHIPLGVYRIVANKGEGDNAHEFEKAIQATELTLDGPNQLAIDFVDISVYPVGGRIVYSIQKNGQDVLVEGAKVKVYPIGSTSSVEALLSKKSLSATGTNYSMPLFAGKYLFVPELSQHDVRIKEDTPGYDSDMQLLTIEDARTDIDFVDNSKRELTVFVEDPGKNRITAYPDTGDAIKVTVSGTNGQVSDEPVDAEGKIVVDMNPGEYTVTVTGASPETKDVDLRGGDQAITMTIPIQIELSFSPRPKLFGVESEFLEQFGLTPADNPEGYMYYYPPTFQKHIYTITATANGKIVEDFTLFVTDEVSMKTADAPVEQEMFVSGASGEYTIEGGLPKKTIDDPPLAAPKKISFRAQKEGYLDSDVVEDEVIVLGDVLVGTAQKIVSIPVVNYTVLHDPPGDGSHAYLNDSMSISGIVAGMKHKIDDEEIPVYPSPWSTERKIKDVDFEEDDDLKEKGLIGYRDSKPTLGVFAFTAAMELATGGGIVYIGGPAGYALHLVKFLATAPTMTVVGLKDEMLKGMGVQYEISPSRRLKTPSGDTLPDLLGPGKGDIYFGEGWTLGLQTKYRLGIKCTERDPDDNCLGWELFTEQVETYDILERTNQYIYTPRDIENIMDDLARTINDPETTDEDQKEKLQDAWNTWQGLLNDNYAYLWAQDLRNGGVLYGGSLDAFFAAHGLSTEEDCETLIFSAGPTFEYSRAISESHGVSFSTSVSASTASQISSDMEISFGFKSWGTGTTYNRKMGSYMAIGSSTSFGTSWKSGSTAKQTVGFVLNDNDIGDNIATRVVADRRWGTPLFFAEPGSITSDPWEPGTNKSVDILMELVDEPTGPFDYHDGAHYKVKLTYDGQRELESSSIGFLVYASAAANTDNLTFRFNGAPGSCGVFLSKETRSATVLVSVYPPEADMGNSEEKEYPVVIGAKESADVQISRKISRSITFADLRAPRATITAPYDGERISPVFFPQDTPFEIEVVSEDTDLKSIQLQIHSKQPNGVWEPWSNLTGMLWEDGGANENVTVFDRLERKPPRREFTFQWTEDAIKSLGVGEYALRAIATDKATTPNVDIDPPSVVFLVDDAKPSVLNSIPDYQARESERIYRGELSITFTDDMRATDFDDRTFYVMDLLNDNEKVAGYVSYSPALRKTVFVPIVPFQPNGFYRVEIKTDEDTDGDGNIDERGVHDLAGNPLDNAFMWTFRTTDAPFEPTWSLTFSVDDGVATDANNIAAVEYGATVEEDEKDVRAVPALSSQLSFSYLNRDKVEFDRDIRPADGRLSHHWFFVICDAANASTVTIRYRPSIKLTKSTRQYQVLRLVEFDSTGQVTNTIALDPTQAQVDPDTGLIPEIEAYTYTNQGETSRYFRLDVQKVGFVAGAFENGTSGWKFFSVPITPQRAEPFVNLGDDIDPFRLYQYETALGGYKVYPFDIGEVGLQAGHGYFTRLEKNVEVDVGGSSNYDDVTLELDAAGWHPIGNPFLLPVDVASLEVNGQTFDSAVASGLVESTLYRWNIIPANADFLIETAISDSYEAVTSDPNSGEFGYLNTWEGYWLKSNQAITLTIPAPPNLPQNPPLPEHYNPPMAPVVSVEHAASLLKSQFDLKLALTSEFASDLTTTLGTHPNAQTGWDTMDSTEPPILGKTVAAYFEHTNWDAKNGQYNRDYQPTLKVGEQRTWKFAVYTKHPDAEMNLSWEKAIAQVPGDIMLYFRRDDGQSDWQNMREVQSVKLTSQLQSTKIPFEVKAERFEMSPPADVEVVAGEKQVLLRWKADDNKFISGYTITRNGFDTSFGLLNPAPQPKPQAATRNTQYETHNTNSWILTSLKK